MMDNDGFATRVATLTGIVLNEQQITHFEQYEALLLSWNKRMNLTAVRTPSGVRARLFLNSLSCATLIKPTTRCNRLIDIGSGAGLPGIPLKIIYPHLQLTLVDSVAKKAQFLQTVVTTLGLDEVTVLAERAEWLGQQSTYRERYDWVVARAVASLPVLVEYLLPLCCVGGLVVAQKGREVESEVAMALSAIEQLGGGKPTIYKRVLPQQTDHTYLAAIAKQQPTPPRFPRRVGVPTKRPL